MYKNGLSKCSNKMESTYLMLSVAEKNQKAFDLLEEDESNHFVVPSSIKWENARDFPILFFKGDIILFYPFHP